VENYKKPQDIRSVDGDLNTEPSDCCVGLPVRYREEVGDDTHFKAVQSATGYKE
jgi:hypothetical protein